VAVNELGNSGSASESAAFLVFAAPAAPEVSTSGRGDGFVEVSWAEPAANGMAIDDYEVEVNGAIWASGVASPFRVDGLSNATPVSIRVRAGNNSDNWGSWSDPISATSSAGAPTSVRPTVRRVDINTVSVSVGVDWPGRRGTIWINGTPTADTSLDFPVGTTGEQVQVRACVDEWDNESCVTVPAAVDLRAPVIVFDVWGQNGCLVNGSPQRNGGTWGAQWRIEAYGLPGNQFSNGRNTALFYTPNRDTFPKTWNASSLAGSDGGWGDQVVVELTVTADVAGYGNLREVRQTQLRCPFP
jgi:hypothetical protein